MLFSSPEQPEDGAKKDKINPTSTTADSLELLQGPQNVGGYSIIRNKPHSQFDFWVQLKNLKL